MASKSCLHYASSAIHSSRILRSISPLQSSIRVSDVHKKKKSCMCSPTNHPGSFRCSLHKKTDSPYSSSARFSKKIEGQMITQESPNLLHARKSISRLSDVENTVVAIRRAQDELVKRALVAKIRRITLSSERKPVFQPRPSRLSVMSKAVVS